LSFHFELVPLLVRHRHRFLLDCFTPSSDPIRFTSSFKTVLILHTFYWILLTLLNITIMHFVIILLKLTVIQDQVSQIQPQGCHQLLLKSCYLITKRKLICAHVWQAMLLPFRPWPGSHRFFYSCTFLSFKRLTEAYLYLLL